MGEAEAKVAETASDEERLQDRKSSGKIRFRFWMEFYTKNDIPTKLIIKNNF